MLLLLEDGLHRGRLKLGRVERLMTRKDEIISGDIDNTQGKGYDAR